MSRRRLVPALGLVLALSLAACGAPTGGDTGIPVQDPDLVAEGDVLYQVNCASCHGADLKGTDLGPSHLSVVYEPSHHGDGAFEMAIRIGTRQHHWPFGDMAPVEGLSDEDIEAIIAFVREAQRLKGFEPYPPG
jgi:mono/diheme cytochrome c family protein